MAAVTKRRQINSTQIADEYRFRAVVSAYGHLYFHEGQTNPGEIMEILQKWFLLAS